MPSRPRLKVGKGPTVTVKRHKNITIVDVNNMPQMIASMPIIKEAVADHMGQQMENAVKEVFKAGGIAPAWEPNTTLTQQQKGGGDPLVGMTRQLSSSVTTVRDIPGGIGSLAETMGTNPEVRFTGWFGATHAGTAAGAPQRFLETRNVPPLTDAQLAFIHEFGLPSSRQKGMFKAGIPARPHITQAADCFGPGILEEGALMVAEAVSSFATVKPISTPVLSGMGGKK